MSGIRVHSLDERVWADARGWGVRPGEAAGLGTVRPGDLHVVSLKPGAVRGDHYHDGTEWLLVTEGTLEVKWRLSEEEPAQARTVKVGLPVLLEIPAGVRHSFMNAGERILYLVAFSDRDKLGAVKAPLP